MKFKPLSDRVVIEKPKEEEKTPGGVVIPDIYREKPQRAVILALGAGPFNNKGVRVPLPMSVGDEILFAKYSGVEMKIPQPDKTIKEYVVLTERDVLAVFGKEKH